MDNYEPIPDCGDYTEADYNTATQADYANEMVMLERLTYETKSNLADLWTQDPTVAMSLVADFLEQANKALREAKEIKLATKH